MITLSPDTEGKPLYIRIYLKIKSDIEGNLLPAGSKLPSKRSLAAHLGVSLNTVDSAYSQLVSEGFIRSEPQRGFFVCPLEELQKLNAAEPAMEINPRIFPAMQNVIDFSPGAIAGNKFPYNVWRKLMKNCFNEYDDTLLCRTPAQGDWGLRVAVAGYLYEARGVKAAPEQIVIGAGTDQLLTIISYILDNSCAVAVENPVYNKAYLMFERMGHQVIPVDVDHQGITLDRIGHLDPVAIYTTPSHQYPLGISMPITRRTKLLNWCGAGNFRYIIEDDYDSEFRYNTKPIPSLQSVDQNNRVIYMGTFSRSVSPSLRISYMVLPPRLLDIYLKKYAFFASPVSAFEQAVLREFITSGYFETHLNRMRVHYKAMRQTLTDALKIFGDSLEQIGEKAGHHIPVRLKSGLSEAEMCSRALSTGVKVYPVTPYFIEPPDETYHSTALLGYGGLSAAEIEKGVQLLYKAWM